VRGRKAVRPLVEVAEAAVGVFTEKGFRRAGISDVSAALGLSHGALYTYVDSKNALLYLALLHAIQPDAVKALAIPVTAPPLHEILTSLEAWMPDSAGSPITVDPAAHPPARRADEELGGVIDALYAFIEGNRQALQLVSQCAADIPELAEWYFVRRRRAMLEQLGEYLRQRMRSGALRPAPDVPAAARFIVESIAWFAMHRHGDPDSKTLDDDTSRRTVRHLLLAAFLPPPSEPA
jgi:AcrR family transcriptional regulator